MLLPMAFQKSPLQWHLFLFVLITLQKLMTAMVTLLSYPEGSAPDSLGSCRSRMCLGAARESFQLGVLCSGSGISLLLLQTVRVAVFSTSRSSTSSYAFLLSNKRITFCYRHIHIHVPSGKAILCPCTCFWCFLASKLSKMLTARQNILLESSNINTSNEWA